MVPCQLQHVVEAWRLNKQTCHFPLCTQNIPNTASTIQPSICTTCTSSEMVVAPIGKASLLLAALTGITDLRLIVYGTNISDYRHTIPFRNRRHKGKQWMTRKCVILVRKKQHKMKYTELGNNSFEVINIFYSRRLLQ